MTERHYEAVYYSCADNRLALFARDYPQGDEGSAEHSVCPPILMMHGLTRNSADFEPLIEALAPRQRLIVPDQRGRALSNYDPEFANYQPGVYVNDMWALLDQLKVEKVICIGTSMGGLMAMMMAAQKPARVAGIVLNDVGPHVSEEGLERIRSYVGPSEPMTSWQAAAQRCEALMGDAIDGFTPEDWMEFARRTCEELADGSVRFAYDPAIAHGMAKEEPTSEPSAVPPDLWGLWDSLKEHPILTIRGSKSDILVPETIAEMARRHPNNFAAHEIPGRGHAPLLDEPQAVAAIRDFLDEYRV